MDKVHSHCSIWEMAVENLGVFTVKNGSILELNVVRVVILLLLAALL